MGIPGLDSAEGLRRVRGKQSLYLWMLRKFIVDQRDTTAKIRAALDAEDLDGRGRGRGRQQTGTDQERHHEDGETDA